MKLSIKNVYIWSSFQKQLDTVKKGKIIKVKGEVSTTTTYDKDNILKYKPMPIDEVVGTINDLISKQPNGEEGVLLANGYVNIFYAICNDGIVRAVDCCWDANNSGWDLYCHEFDDDGWDDGPQFFVSDTLELENNNPLTLSKSDTLTLERAIGICVMNGYNVSVETIKIGEHTYNKDEVETALKDLKAI